jgi:hypothetical protein
MGIDAFVLEGKDLARRDLYTPLITLNFFKKRWLPAIESLNLEWLRCFTSGLDLTKKELPYVLHELQKIKEWGKNNLSEGEYDYMDESITKLQNMLDEAFKHEDVVVFIG